ncbi:hypothetical protein PCANC_03173 [Puccinia coronata f. sp. avenae]|uniref:Uncharacterized protein n=1 Tax=Puccinia coronata f. sp. avenae TaxID=200324 RepID=A0A2N5T836_9BASI|nr:hypothetical protein PCANC_03173 [Puccinia coronata f. sp. avenae]
MLVRLLPSWLLVIGLLASIVKSAVYLTNYDDTLKAVTNNARSLVNRRTTATKISGEEESPRSWEEMIRIGKKITGDHPGVPKAEIYDENQAREIKIKETQTKLYESLERIQTLDIRNHPEQGAFDSLIERFQEHMEFFTAPAMEENKEKIKDAELDRKAVHEKEKLTQVFKAFQNIDGFLGSTDKHRSSFFCYCDIFVEYLYASERYGSLGRKP